METKKFKVITNNPLVLQKLKDLENIYYLELDYKDILLEVRKMVYDGYELLSHPLSGSVKPGETPYKSILVSDKKEILDIQSIKLIENSLLTFDKFVDKTKKLNNEVLSDFQIVDMELLQSALISANRI